MAKDKINHPSHYKGFKVEAWDCVRTFDFFTGNVVKYLMRAPFKGFPAEDFEKAASYVAYLNTRPDCRSCDPTSPEFPTYELRILMDRANWSEWEDAIGEYCEDSSEITDLAFDAIFQVVSAALDGDTDHTFVTARYELAGVKAILAAKKINAYVLGQNKIEGV
jgi:hypothetical protein